MRSTRRQYLEGLIGTAGIITVTSTGTAVPSEDTPRNGPPNEIPPRQGRSVIGLSEDPIDQVGVGIIGLGNRGSSMTSQIAVMYPDKLEIRAICDLVEDRVEDTATQLQERGMDPATYSAGIAEDEWDGQPKWREDDLNQMVDSGWREMIARNDLDIVFVFTHHRAHAPMCVAILNEGKHAATEIPAATTVKECWDIVQAAERNQKQCIMLENVNYFEEEMWVLNMAQQGVFGELTYGSGGYIHNQVGSFMHDYGPPVNWRSRMYLEEKGDLYPTHGLGPIAWYMDVNRGDRMEFIVSQESPETRFSQHAQNDLKPDHEFYGETDWTNGDTTRSLIQTSLGRSIEVQLDVKTNRPYNRYNELAGSDAWHRGLGDDSKLAINEINDHGVLDDETYDEYWDEYSHPLWSDETLQELADEYGSHGGGDFLMLYRVFDALNEGRPFDFDVYDAATWSAVRPLSGISIEHGSRPVKFPDFTRGAWENERTLEIQKFETI